MAILKSENKNTDFLMILAWLSLWKNPQSYSMNTNTFYWPPAKPEVVASDFFISVSLNARSDFMFSNSSAEGKWWNLDKFYIRKKKQ